MGFYNRQHRHYCGIDLHVKTMYVCILGATGHAASTSLIRAARQGPRERE